MAQFIHVDAAGGNVGGHQHAQVTAFEGLHCLFPLGLALVAMDGLTANALFAEVADQFVRAVFGAGEDQRARHIRGLEHIDEQVLLLGLAHEVDLLLDGLGGGAAALHLHGDRVEEDGVGQLLDVLRHRGGEEQGLAPGGQELDDLADVVDEAHVEHGVGLVQHEVLEVIQSDVALVDEVQKAPGGGHDNVHTTLERGDLLALFDPAEDDGVVELLVLAVVADALADLGGEFARWTQDQGADDPAALPARLLAEPMEHGKGKGRRLAGAGLGDTEDVFAVHDVGNGLGLNGGRGLVAKGNEGPHEGFAQSERMEIGQGGLGLWVAMPSPTHPQVHRRFRAKVAPCGSRRASSLPSIAKKALGTVSRPSPRVGFRRVRASPASRSRAGESPCPPT